MIEEHNNRQHNVQGYQIQIMKNKKNIKVLKSLVVNSIVANSKTILELEQMRMKS